MLQIPSAATGEALVVLGQVAQRTKRPRGTPRAVDDARLQAHQVQPVTRSIEEKPLCRRLLLGAGQVVGIGADGRGALVDQGGAINLLTDWVLLDSYLRLRGAVARYAYAGRFLPSKPPEEAVELCRHLDRTSVYGGALDSTDNSFGAMTAGGFEFGPRGHPLEAGHAYFAERLEAWLRGQGLDFSERARAPRNRSVTITVGRSGTGPGAVPSR
ncbi:DUF6071 family protein [Actinosynnema sp. NPDC023794]